MEGEFTVRRGEGTDEMVLKGLYCAFGCVDQVIVGFDEQEIALLCGEEAFNLPACLIVHHVQFYFETFALEELKLLFVGLVYRGVFHVLYREAKYRI